MLDPKPHRFRVFLCKSKLRRFISLQWYDPQTGMRRSKSAGTDDPQQAEVLRERLEVQLNEGHDIPQRADALLDIDGAIAAIREHANSREGLVYFIREMPYGPVKIGWAKDVAVRCATLETGNSRQLLVYGVCWGPLSLEKRLHRYFAPINLAREWFDARPVFLAFIHQHTDEFDWKHHRVEPSRPRVSDEEMKQAVANLHVPDFLRKSGA
jgi:hypothetical protein